MPYGSSVYGTATYGDAGTGDGTVFPAGPPDAMAVEVQWDGTNWTDVTGEVDTWDLKRGRDPGEALQPSELTVVLFNAPHRSTGIAPYTLNNPLSPYFPNVKRGVQVRVKISRGSTITRFLGRIEALKASGGNPATQTVTLTCTGALGQFQRRQMLSDYGEHVIQYADPNSFDYWPFDEDGDDAQTLRNVGAGAPVDAEVIASGIGYGTVTFAQPDSPIIDGWATFGRDQNIGTAPIILCSLQNEPTRRISWWARTEPGYDPGNGWDDAIVAWGPRNEIIWRFGAADVGSNVMEWQFRAADGVTVYVTTSTGGGADGKAIWFTVLANAIGSQIDVYTGRVGQGADTYLSSAAVPVATNNIAYLTVGGYMNPDTPRKNLNVAECSIGGLEVRYQAAGSSVFPWSSPLATRTAHARALDLYVYGQELALGGTAFTTNQATTTVAATQAAGRSLLDLWAELEVTEGGLVVENPNGSVTWRSSTDSRLAAVAATITLGADDDASTALAFTTGAADVPTRATATSPVGTAVAVNTARDAVARVEGPTVATCAGTLLVAQAVASAAISSAGAPNVQVKVNLTTAATDLYSDFLLIREGSRVRIDGLPAGSYGVTYFDFYVTGWTESWDSATQAYSFTLTGTPSDAPPEGVTDDAEYGRVSAGDGVVTVSAGSAATVGAGGGNLILNWDDATYGQWSLDTADYPMDLNWNGEKIRVLAPPATSYSPITLNVPLGNRGLAPTVARVHAGGEPIDVWHAAAVAQ